MPIYEFDCLTCGRPFENLVRSFDAITDVRCPYCGSDVLKRKIPLFATRTSGRSSAGGAACSTGGT